MASEAATVGQPVSVPTSSSDTMDGTKTERPDEAPTTTTTSMSSEATTTTTTTSSSSSPPSEPEVPTSSDIMDGTRTERSEEALTTKSAILSEAATTTTTSPTETEVEAEATSSTAITNQADPTTVTNSATSSSSVSSSKPISLPTSRRRNSSDEYGIDNTSLGSFDPPSILDDKLRSNSIFSAPSSTTSVISSKNEQLPLPSEESNLFVKPNIPSTTNDDDDKDDESKNDNNSDEKNNQMKRTRAQHDVSDPELGDEPSSSATGASTAAAAATVKVSAAAALGGTYKPSVGVAPAPSVLLSGQSGRKPLRKRKGSVDFTFTLDDNDSNTSTAQYKRRRLNSYDNPNNPSTAASDVHHSVDALPPMGALPDIDVLASKDDPTSHSHDDTSSFLAGDGTSGILASTSSTIAHLLPPPTSPLGGAAAAASTTTEKTKGRARSRTNSSAGAGSTNTEAAESLLSMGSASSSKGSGADGYHKNQTMTMPPPPLAPTKDNTTKQRHHKESISSHPSRNSKNSHTSSNGGGSLARRRFRAYSEDNMSHGSHSGHETLTSQSHRFLLEAFMGDGTESLVLDPEQRERLGSFDGVSGVGETASEEKDHPDESRPVAAAATTAAAATVASTNRHDSQNSNAYGRDRFTSIDYGRRERLESWGGMSDLSGHGLHDHHSDTLGSGSQSATAAALAATIYTSLANDVTAAAAADGNESVSSFLVSDEKIPTRISVNRDRLNSVASVATDPSALFQGSAAAHASTGNDAEFPSDVQKYMKAAMASVGDQLADIAASAEGASGLSFKDPRDHHEDSEISSTASRETGSKSGSLTGRPRSSSVSSLLNIAVDYDAVAAAVEAAEAASGAMDLTNFTSSNVGDSRGSGRKKRALPLHRKGGKKKSLPSSGSLTGISEFHVSRDSDLEVDYLRAEARAAAGYVGPKDSSQSDHALPPKKRRKKQNDSPDQVLSASSIATPKTKPKAPSSSNKKKKTPKTPKGDSTPGQAAMKWESMLDALKEYAIEREELETRHMTPEQKARWSWDGNVPTMYKTKDGKALGRWVNNQRSAKSKGSLKEEREDRLVAAGLKWTVQASSSWNEMLEELKLYIADQNRQGKEWDGNVPTNYCIKLAKNTCEDDEKNLGRWVNRQRSMYQAGRLREDRQIALEKIGLKWSVLTSITWESMFDTLCEYVEERKECTGRPWDGNVPATYKTVRDDPPRALGRWINRQRSAYSKGKLKDEYVAKLNSIGLRWSIHSRDKKKAPPLASGLTISDVAPKVSPDFPPQDVNMAMQPDNVASMEIGATLPMEAGTETTATPEDIVEITTSAHV